MQRETQISTTSRNTADLSGPERLTYLVWRLQFLGLHLPEDVVGGAKRAHLGVAHLHVRWQTDEPQAVAVTEEALGPQLGDGRVLLGDLLR